MSIIYLRDLRLNFVAYKESYGMHRRSKSNAMYQTAHLNMCWCLVTFFRKLTCFEAVGVQKTVGDGLENIVEEADEGRGEAADGGLFHEVFNPKSFQQEGVDPNVMADTDPSLQSTVETDRETTDAGVDTNDSADGGATAYGSHAENSIPDASTPFKRWAAKWKPTGSAAACLSIHVHHFLLFKVVVLHSCCAIKKAGTFDIQQMPSKRYYAQHARGRQKAARSWCRAIWEQHCRACWWACLGEAQESAGRTHLLMAVPWQPSLTSTN